MCSLTGGFPFFSLMSAPGKPKKRKQGVFREGFDAGDEEKGGSQSLKNRIRSLTRLLAKEVRRWRAGIRRVWWRSEMFAPCPPPFPPQDLPKQARKDKTRLLKKMQREAAERRRVQKEAKLAQRYHKVRCWGGCAPLFAVAPAALLLQCAVANPAAPRPR